jgi:hypothetical protein
MNQHDGHSSRPLLEQVYLVVRDTGLLCRILGLYAARGLDVQRADYAYAAPDVMTLKVAARIENANSAQTVRILVEKAATLVGVICAAEQPPPLGVAPIHTPALPSSEAYAKDGRV